jgi:hypothetical protein
MGRSAVPAHVRKLASDLLIAHDVSVHEWLRRPPLGASTSPTPSKLGNITQSICRDAPVIPFLAHLDDRAVALVTDSGALRIICTGRKTSSLSRPCIAQIG